MPESRTGFAGMRRWRCLLEDSAQTPASTPTIAQNNTSKHRFVEVVISTRTLATPVVAVFDIFSA